MIIAGSLRQTGDDLWTAAVATLDDGLKAEIDFTQGSKEKALDELLGATEDARRRLVAKSWSFTRPNGKKVIVRDVLNKVTKWVNHFKDIGDIIVQYDPGHAALPWAGVRFLLNVAIGDLTTYNNMLERVAEVTEFMCRSAILENIARDSSLPTANELTHALVKLYAKILIYLAMSRSYYNQKTSIRLLKHGALASFDLDNAFADIGKAHKDVESASDLLGLHAHLTTHQRLQQILQDVDAPVRRWDEDLKVLRDELNTKKRNEVLRWLSDEPYKQHHQRIHDGVMEGTGQWLLQDQTFLQWKNESASSILWLHGIPGSGKSKLASIVVNDAQEDFNNQQSTAPIYFYCSRNTNEHGRSDPSRIVGSIARQLSVPIPGGSLLEDAVAVHRQHEQDGFAAGQLDFNANHALIRKLLERYKSASVTLVIDALDECAEASRDSLLDMLTDLLKTSPCLLKIFVSSRDDQDLVIALKDYPNLEISSGRNWTDIDKFVRTETSELIRKGRLLAGSYCKEELERRIVDELTSNARGMFRWASLQLEELCRQCTDDAVRERLSKLPPDLAGLYEEIFSRIENYSAEADRKVTFSAFCWLLCGRESLRSHCFLAAVSLTENGIGSRIRTEELLRLCCNLVIYDRTLDVFVFSHLSVRDFLESRAEFEYSSFHGLVAEACLGAIGKMPADWKQIQLRNYCDFYWGLHMQEAWWHGEKESRLKKVLLKFLSGDRNEPSRLEDWQRRVRDATSRPQKMESRLQAATQQVPSVLLVLCAFDLIDVLGVDEWRRHVRNDAGAASNLHQITAASHGYGAIIWWHWENHEPFATDESIICAAASNEAYGKQVMQMFLDKEELGVQITEKVLCAAARNSKSGRELLALLLDRCSAEVHITEAVVVSATQNRECAPAIFELFFRRRGAQVRIAKAVMLRCLDAPTICDILDRSVTDIPMTTETVCSVIRNSRRSQSVMELLLNRCKAGNYPTQSARRLIVRNFDVSIVKQLINLGGPDSDMNEHVVQAARDNYRYDVMDMLLDTLGSTFPITHEAVMAAIWCGGTTKLIHLRWPDVRITPDTISAAIHTGAITGKDLALLVSKCEVDSGPISEKVAAAVIERFNTFTLQEFLEESKLDIQLNQDIVEAAYFNLDRFQCRSVMSVLLEMHTAGNPVPEGVMKNIMRWFGDTLMEQILATCVFEMPPTQHLVTDIVRLGSLDSITRFLDDTGSDLNISEGIIEAAAHNTCCPDVMVMLLKKNEGRVRITSNILQTAMRNQQHGLRLTELLLDEPGMHISFTEEVMEVAISSVEMMTLLFDKRDAEIHVTEDMVQTILNNGECGYWVLEFLLGKRQGDIPITQRAIVSKADDNTFVPHMMRLLLMNEESQILATKGVAAEIIRTFDDDIIELYLKKHGTSAQPTERRLRDAIENPSVSAHTISTLINMGGVEMDITDDMIDFAATCDNETHGREVLSLLLERRGCESPVSRGTLLHAAKICSLGMINKLLGDQQHHHIQFTEDLLEAAAHNLESGTDVVSYFLDVGVMVTVTEIILEAAAKNEKCGDEIMVLLLDKCEGKICLTEPIVTAAASNDYKGNEIMATLLDKVVAGDWITQDAVEAIVERFGSGLVDKLLDRIFDHQGDGGTDLMPGGNIFHAAIRNRWHWEEVISLLLDRLPSSVQVTEDALIAIQKAEDAREIMHWLLKKMGRHLSIGETLVSVAAKHRLGVLDEILEERGSDLPFTDTIVELIMQYGLFAQVKRLLETRGADISVTENVVLAAASSFSDIARRDPRVLECFLDKYLAEMPITENVVTTMVYLPYYSPLETLFYARQQDIQVTEEVLVAVAGNRHTSRKALRLILALYDIYVTEVVVQVAIENPRNDSDTIQILLDRCASQFQVTEGIWMAAVNGRCDRDIALVLLQYVQQPITESVVVSAARNELFGRYTMTLFLDKCEPHLLTSGRVVETLVRESYPCAIRYLFQGRSAKVKVSEDILRAAVQNKRHGKQVTSLLLGICKADSPEKDFVITESILKAAAQNDQSGKDVLELLVNESNGFLNVTDSILVAAGTIFDPAIMTLLLDKYEPKVLVSEDAMDAICRLCHHRKVSRFLQRYGEFVQITQDTLVAAAGNWESGDEVTKLLLADYPTPAENIVLENILTAAAQNSSCGHKVVMVLLEELEIDVPLTTNIIRSAATNQETGLEVVRRLLERCAPASITETIALSILNSFEYGTACRLLRKYMYRNENLITRNTIATFTKVVDYELFKSLVDKIGFEISQDTLEAAVQNETYGSSIVRRLLNRSHLVITEKVLEATVQNRKEGLRIIAAIFDNRGVEIRIIQGLLRAAAQMADCSEIVGYLLKRRHNDTLELITPDLCLHAAACGNPDSLRYLGQFVPPTQHDSGWELVARLYRAACDGDLDEVNQLSAQEFPKNSTDNHGRTPLWIAASRGHAEVVKVLGDLQDVDINALSNSGQSPIFSPSANGRGDIVEVLLAAGARTGFVDVNQKTARLLAEGMGHDDVVRMISAAEVRERLAEQKGLWWKSGGRLMGVSSFLFLLAVIYVLIGI